MRRRRRSAYRRSRHGCTSSSASASMLAALTVCRRFRPAYLPPSQMPSSPLSSASARRVALTPLPPGHPSIRQPQTTHKSLPSVYLVSLQFHSFVSLGRYHSHAAMPCTHAHYSRCSWPLLATLSDDATPSAIALACTARSSRSCSRRRRAFAHAYRLARTDFATSERRADADPSTAGRRRPPTPHDTCAVLCCAGS